MNNHKNNNADVAHRHQMNIARETMKMSCIGAQIMGCMNHVKAAQMLGASVPDGCTCCGKKDKS